MPPSSPCVPRRRRVPWRAGTPCAAAEPVGRCRPSWHRTSHRGPHTSPLREWRPPRKRRRPHRGRSPGRTSHRLVGCHRGEHPRLELRDIGHDQRPPGVGTHRRAQAPRKLERSPPAEAHRPVTTPPGMYGAEPAVMHPFRQPRPPVGAEQPGELLVRQQRFDDRVVVLGELPPAR